MCWSSSKQKSLAAAFPAYLCSATRLGKMGVGQRTEGISLKTSHRKICLKIKGHFRNQKCTVA